MQELKILNEKIINREDIKKELEIIFKNVKDNITFLNSESEKRKIYITISESRELEKAVHEKFKYTYLENSRYNYYKINDNLINSIETAFYHRFRNVLNKIGFISINEKNKTIKVKASYNQINLYYLNYIATFEGNLNDNSEIEIIKEYKNNTIEFKFKNSVNYDLFNSIVFFHNDITQYIINNIDDNTIQKYKEKLKEKHYNEFSVIYEWIQKNNKLNFNIHLKPINFKLLNKCLL
jgi:hypothetical protein